MKLLRGKRKSLIVFILLALIAAAPSADARVVHKRWIARGVTYTAIRQNHPKLSINVITTRLQDAPALEVALGTGELPGWEKTSSMARRNDAIAAINGDYGRPSGRPVMAFARDGHIEQTPLTWGRNFALNASRNRAFIGHPNVHVSAYVREDNATLNIKRVNAGPPSEWNIAMFTPAGGTLERPPTRSCSARLAPTGGSNLGPDGLGVLRSYRVAFVHCGYRPMYTKGGVVLTTPAQGARAWLIRQMAVGQNVTLTWSLGWPGAIETVGGNPTLIEAGRIVVGRSNLPFFRPNPRTGVGTTPDGRVLLVTVDGRRPRFSRGVTLRGFAHIFRKLGATWALNLDGGGSTTMFLRGRGVVNRPSDGYERPVSSALLLVPRSRVPSGLPIAEPEPIPIDPAPEIPWPSVATDPGSTGGMADSLVATKNKVPSVLRDMARSFERSVRRATSRRLGR